MFHTYCDVPPLYLLANPAHARMKVLQFRRAPFRGLQPWRKGTLLRAHRPSWMVTRGINIPRLRRWERKHITEIHLWLSYLSSFNSTHVWTCFPAFWRITRPATPSSWTVFCKRLASFVGFRMSLLISSIQLIPKWQSADLNAHHGIWLNSTWWQYHLLTSLPIAIHWFLIDNHF